MTNKEIVIGNTTVEVNDLLSIEQAARLIKTLDGQSENLVFRHFLMKFDIGRIVSLLDVPFGKRMEALAELKLRTGIHENQLRKWLNIYKHFNGDYTLFRSKLMEMGRPTEYLIDEFIGTNTDPKVLGERALATRTINRIERIARDVEQLVEMRDQGTVTSEEFDGVVGTALGAIQEYGDRPTVIVKTPRSDEYLSRVRELPCAVTSTTPSEAHHVEVGGKGIKGSDYSCIPLSREAHLYYHNNGPYAFEDFYGVRIGDLIAQTIHAVLTGRRLTIPTSPSFEVED